MYIINFIFAPLDFNTNWRQFKAVQGNSINNLVSEWMSAILISESSEYFKDILETRFSYSDEDQERDILVLYFCDTNDNSWEIGRLKSRQ